MRDKLDLGCGPAKPADCDGMDLHAYRGVDYVHDLDGDGCWPIDDNRYSYIRAMHVIEHLRDLRKFFTEVHRIAKPGAIVHLETPHYSSRQLVGGSDACSTLVRRFLSTISRRILG